MPNADTLFTNQDFDRVTVYVTSPIVKSFWLFRGDRPEKLAGITGQFIRFAWSSCEQVIFSSEVDMHGCTIEFGTNITFAGSACGRVPCPPRHGCFASGTAVKMGDGSLVPIEKVQEGDVVASAHGLGGSSHLAKVVGTRSHEEMQTVTMQTSTGETIRASANQPIVTIAGPVQIEHLRVGARFLGTKTTVAGIQRIAEPVLLYSLDIEHRDPFFVYAGAPLQVNCKPTPNPKCLLGETIIRMADGSHAAIVDLRSGDELATTGDDLISFGSLRKSVVRSVTKHIEPMYLSVVLSDGSKLKCSASHLIPTREGPVEARSLFRNSYLLLGESDDRIVVKSVEPVFETVEVYRLEHESDDRYIIEVGDKLIAGLNKPPP